MVLVSRAESVKFVASLLSIKLLPISCIFGPLVYTMAATCRVYG